MISINKSILGNYFILNNKIIGTINIKRLIKQDIEIPNEQRLKLKEKIKEIVKYQDNYFSKYKYLNFQGAINIHCCKETNKNYLVDGQHRYFAIKKLAENENYKNEKILIEIVIIKNLEELRENFEIINKNTKMPKFPKNLNKSVIEKTC